MTVLTVSLLTGVAGLALAVWGICEWRADRRARREAEGRRVIEGTVVLTGKDPAPLTGHRARDWAGPTRALPVYRGPLWEAWLAWEAPIAAARQAVGRAYGRRRRPAPVPIALRPVRTDTPPQGLPEVRYSPPDWAAQQWLRIRRATAAQPTLWEA